VGRLLLPFFGITFNADWLSEDEVWRCGVLAPTHVYRVLVSLCFIEVNINLNNIDNVGAYLLVLRDEKVL
jgi:hypothetical protein